MALDSKSIGAGERDAAAVVLNDLISLCALALGDAETAFIEARAAVRARVEADGKVSSAMLEAEQNAAHGLAWVATYVEALRQMLDWARRLEASGVFAELEQLILQAAFAEYLAQLKGGVPMSQGELIRPRDFGVAAFGSLESEAATTLIAAGGAEAVRARDR